MPVGRAMTGSAEGHATRLGPVTRLLHLSDTHLHAPGARTMHPEIDSRARLEEVLDRARPYGPFDAVVVTGDVCDDGSEEGARAVRELVEGLAPVVLAVPGNHDLSEPVRRAFGEPGAQVGPWRFVGVETQVVGEVAGVGQPVVEALAGMDGQPTVLFMHHPVESRSTHEWFTLSGHEEAVRAVAEHRGPLVVLSGHTHEGYRGRLGAAYLIGSPSTYYSIRHRGDEFDFVLEEFGTAVVTLPEPGAEPAVDVLLLTDDQLVVEDRIDLPGTHPATDRQEGP